VLGTCVQLFYLLLFSFLPVLWQDILFCNFRLGGGSCELQMCMAFAVA